MNFSRWFDPKIAESGPFFGDWGQRQGKQKSRTVIQFALGTDGAGMCQHNVLGDS
jgi:hypothetical protein